MPSRSAPPNGKYLNKYYELHQTDLTRLDARLQKVVSIVTALPARNILDIGCGRGTLLRALRVATPLASERSYIGVDISEAAIRHVSSLGFEAIAASAETGLPFKDESFDLVVFGEVIEHLYDPDAALLEISRVLRRGGQIVLTTPNLAFWVNRVLLLFGLHPIFPEVSVHVQLGRYVKLLGQGNPAVGHIRVFTLPALKDMIEANGYRISAVFGTPSHETRGFGFNFIDRAFARKPSLASNLVILATNDRTLSTSYAISSSVSIR